jgi:hypothetical protein
MAQPCPDGIDLDARVEEVDRPAASKGMRVQAVVFLPQCAAHQCGSAPFYDFVDSESCERLPLLATELSQHSSVVGAQAGKGLPRRGVP